MFFARQAEQKQSESNFPQHKSSNLHANIHPTRIQRAIAQPSPETLTRDVVVSLQRMYGNHFVVGLVQRARDDAGPLSDSVPISQLISHITSANHQTARDKLIQCVGKKRTRAEFEEEDSEEEETESENTGGDDYYESKEDIDKKYENDIENLVTEFDRINQRPTSTMEEMPFYSKIASILEGARSGDEKSQALIRGVAKEYGQIADNWSPLVRVESTKMPELAGGSGLDELFKTEKTSIWLLRAAGLAFLDEKMTQKVASVSLFNGEPFDWMDAQRYVRVKTELVMWKTQDEELAGHTGALKMKKSGFYTKGQDVFHKERNAEIMKSKSPREGVINALRYHIDHTVDAEQWKTAKLRGRTVAHKTKSLKQGDKYAEEVGKVLQAHREQLVKTLKEFEDHSAEVEGKSAKVSKETFAELGSKMQTGGNWEQAKAAITSAQKGKNSPSPPPTKKMKKS